MIGIVAARRRDHISPLLHGLHWLRVAERKLHFGWRYSSTAACTAQHPPSTCQDNAASLWCPHASATELFVVHYTRHFADQSGHHRRQSFLCCCYSSDCSSPTAMVRGTLLRESLASSFLLILLLHEQNSTQQSRYCVPRFPILFLHSDYLTLTQLLTHFSSTPKQQVPTVYIGLSAFSKLPESSRMFWNIRELSRPAVRRQLSWLTAHAA